METISNFKKTFLLGGDLESQDIAFIPWFPIGGGIVQLEEKLKDIASRKQVTMHQLALSWLLHHSDNILLIPGTSSIAHLEENVSALSIELTADDKAELDCLIESVENNDKA